MTAREVSILANNGDIGGGEVMLLALAAAARGAGYIVRVVAPAEPSECADAATERGFEVVRIPGAGRKAYMKHLRSWAKGRSELLWCNGLVPASATALLRGTRRVVHLHRLPEGAQRAAAGLARLGSVDTVILSDFMRRRLGYGTVLPNWSEQTPSVQRPQRREDVTTVGFLGRLTPDKGIVELADAIVTLNGRQERRYDLVVAGEPRFVGPEDQAVVERALEQCDPWLERGGWMDRADLFSRIDLLAVPSLWEEPFGLVATEAMAARVPLVVTRSGALPEIVGPHHPYVVDRGDALALADAIENLVTHPEATVQATQAAYDRWLREFSPDVGERRFVALLDSLTSSEGRLG